MTREHKRMLADIDRALKVQDKKETISALAAGIIPYLIIAAAIFDWVLRGY